MSNWYFIGFPFLIIAILHIVNNLAVPVWLGHAKSYTISVGRDVTRRHGAVVVRPQHHHLLSLPVPRYAVLLPA